jgi:Na+-translocating ferredoxin:NAD+ oxidoreductase subunit B
MNEDIYLNLAGILDSLPNGFPRTESGVEIKLLKKIFAPDEAELFCDLKLVKETAGEISRRTGRPHQGLEAKLNDMWWKGQIECDPTGEEKRYCLAPWIVGIFEFQVRFMDEEFARLHVEYIKSAGLFFMKKKPQVMQVVPIEKEVPDGNEAIPFAQVSALIERSNSFAVNECICKKQAGLIGRECEKPREVCLLIAETPGFYDNHPMAGRIITREEARDILNRAEEAGLVHMTANLQQGHWFICNCCGCCCSQLLAARFGMKGAVNSHYHARINVALCRNCGLCSDTRCQIKAVDVVEEHRVINEDKCIGCGLCVSTCPAGAISLIHKSADRIIQPPRDEKEWYRIKAQNEKKDISKFE